MRRRSFADWKEYLLFSSGLARLGHAFPAFLFVHFFFLLDSNLQTVFVNTLLQRLTGGSDAAFIYNMIYFASAALFFVPSYRMLRRYRPTTVLRVGVAMFLVMYIIFLAVLSKLDRYFVLIALLHGLSAAYYWAAYTTLLGQYTSDDNRDLAIGMLGIANGITVLVMPAVAGWVIACFTDLTGYVIMFGAATAFAAVTLLLSLRLVPLEPIGGRHHFLEMWRMFFTKKMFVCFGAGEIVRSFRDGIMTIYLNILLFQVVQNEALVGFNTLITGLMSILASYLYGRWISPTRRIRSMFISTTLITLFTLALNIHLSPATIILFAAANAALVLFLNNPVGAIIYQITNGIPAFSDLRTDFFCVRELLVGVGRMIGFTFVLLMPRSVETSLTVLLVLALSQYLLVFFERVTYREIRRMES